MVLHWKHFCQNWKKIQKNKPDLTGAAAGDESAAAFLIGGLMAVLTIEELKAALADTPEYNKPLGNTYLNPSELTTAIALAVEDYNESNPILDVMVDIDTYPSKRSLLYGAMVEALRLTALKELRGRMDYSDGGVQNALYTKSPEFLALQNQYTQMYETAKSRIKRQKNMSNCYGGLY